MGNDQQIPMPKYCRYCKKTKQSFDFSKMKDSPDGLQYRCKKCVAEYRVKNADHLRELSRIARKKRLQEDPEHERKNYAKLMKGFKDDPSLPVNPDIVKKLKQRIATEVKHCTGCNQDLPLTKFYVRIRMGRWIDIRTLCRECHNKATVKKQTRSNKYLVGHYRRQAIRGGYEFDLDLEFITISMAKPCSYCGSNDDLKTIDRKNSDNGYLKDNCTTSCLRCNLVKSDMPYQAWLIVANGMREARELGLFGTWTGRKNFATTKRILESVVREQISNE